MTGDERKCSDRREVKWVSNVNRERIRLRGTWCHGKANSLSVEYILTLTKGMIVKKKKRTMRPDKNGNNGPKRN